ncbi:site-specific integrase [Streptococcus uberis]|uniref:tyrosine-type recombinase/integrase n=1 Tax=Streptococcus uberis TaxID=1349 RepID=UPI0038915ABD
MKIIEYKKNDGTVVYRSQIYLGIDVITGKKVSTRITGRTKKEINNKIKKAKADFIINGKTVSKSSNIVTYRDLAELWWDSYKHSIKPNSYIATRSRLDNHLLKHFGDYKLDKLTTPIIQQVFNDYADRYNNNKKNAFANFGILHSMNRRILQYGVINQVIVSNPARDVVLPRKISKDKKLNYLDNKELKKFLTYLDGLDVRIYKNLYDITLYRFLLATGCRIGEALALEWSDIDFSNSYISVTKTVNSYRKINSTKSKSGNRIIDIDKNTVAMMKEYKKRQTQEAWKLGRSEKLIFSNFIDLYPDHSALRQRVNKHYQMAGVDNTGFHAFRHTHASLLLNSGIPYKELQNRLGHSTLAMTMDIYSHLSKESAKKAVTYFETAINAI